jgi:hypothetical protein
MLLDCSINGDGIIKIDNECPTSQTNNANCIYNADTDENANTLVKYYKQTNTTVITIFYI